MSTMPLLSQYISTDQPTPERVSPPGEITIRSQSVVLQKILQRPRVEILAPEPRPTNISLGTINDPRFRVIKAIPVHLDAREDTVVATWSQIEEFGTGKSTSLACDDLGHTLAELYESLEADQSRLGPDLASVWSVLKDHVARRS